MLEDITKREIIAIYRQGGFDPEAIAILCKQVQGFQPQRFNQWIAESLEFREFIEGCRILARAYWDKRLREGTGALPSWYYGSLPLPVLELITLATQTAELQEPGSAAREREFKNVARVLEALRLG